MITGHLGEVASELVQHGRTRLGRTPTGGGGAGAGGLVPGTAGEELDDRMPHSGQVGTQLLQHLGRHPVPLPDQAEEDVLGADVVMSQLQRLPQAQLQDFLRPGSERDVPGRGLVSLPDGLHHLATHGIQPDAEVQQAAGGDPLAFVDETEEDVLGSDVVVVEQPRFFLGQDHHPAGPVGEAFEHWR